MRPTQMSSQFPALRLSLAARMADYNRRLAQRIKQERERNGWRREDLAQITGASYRQIERWETGKSAPQAANLRKLADAFELEIGDLRPDLEAEEEVLRAQLRRVEQKLDAVLRALKVSPDDVREFAAAFEAGADGEAPERPAGKPAAKGSRPRAA